MQLSHPALAVGILNAASNESTRVAHGVLVDGVLEQLPTNLICNSCSTVAAFNKQCQGPPRCLVHLIVIQDRHHLSCQAGGSNADCPWRRWGWKSPRLQRHLRRRPWGWYLGWNAT